ncbi:MAG: glycosyltransferase family 39 protein [Actinobacteria bacterium]|nr:glycosyltransferase family 39 protein [Actinomycetota bacterium]
MKRQPLVELAGQGSPLARARTRVPATEYFWAGTAAVTAALAGVLGWLLRAWPPHEDEALALFVGRGSLGHVLRTVLFERGGAPLHFGFAWAIVHLGGGLTALRLVSLVFAVASVPLIALLGKRLAGPAVGVAAALLASGTWAVLFHGIYGRMYSLFLFTSLLSFLALLSALDVGGRRRFALWGLAVLAMLASHPYAVLVVAAQSLFVVVRRRRVREAALTLAAVGVFGVPFWWADIVLRNRFDIGVGGGGPQLGSPTSVLHYFWWVSGDFSTGHHAWSIPVLLLALAGAVLLWRRRPEVVVLIACVIAIPALAFMLATLNSTTSPEARHLIFALPFFSILLAAPLVELAGLRPPLTGVLALLAVVTLVVGEVRWVHQKTPQLFDGDPPGEAQARSTAGAWLASTDRPSDVLLGYEPVYLRAWEQDRSFTGHVLPRADPALLASTLQDIREPIGRGIWVLDASDTTNITERQTIPFVLPAPGGAAFEGRVYGPFLVIRSREPLVTRAHYLSVAENVMRVGVRLGIGDADVNLRTLLRAASRL